MLTGHLIRALKANSLGSEPPVLLLPPNAAAAAAADRSPTRHPLNQAVKVAASLADSRHKLPETFKFLPTVCQLLLLCSLGTTMHERRPQIGIVRMCRANAQNGAPQHIGYISVRKCKAAPGQLCIEGPRQLDADVVADAPLGPDNRREPDDLEGAGEMQTLIAERACLDFRG